MTHGDLAVVDMPMEFLHDGLPRREMVAAWTDAAPTRACDPPDFDAALLLALLRHPDVASKEGIVRHYDHEVQGGTVVRPFVGSGGRRPGRRCGAEAAGDRAQRRRRRCVSNGICPRVGLLDPWAMALLAIDEAVRNLVAVGGDPDRVAVLDNFCWGDPTKPDRLGALVRAVQGCTDGARRYGTPFISGKDSLYNEFDGTAIPGTLLISAVGLVPDMHRAIDSAGMAPGDDLWLVGPEHGRARRVARRCAARPRSDRGPGPARRPAAALPGRAPRHRRAA